MNKCPSDSHNQPEKKRRATEALASGSSKVHRCFSTAPSGKHNSDVPQTLPPATGKRAGTDQNTSPRPPRTVPTPDDHQTAKSTCGAWERSAADDIQIGTDEVDELPAMVADKKVRPQHISRTLSYVAMQSVGQSEALSAGKGPFRHGMVAGRGSFLNFCSSQIVRLTSYFVSSSSMHRHLIVLKPD
jgi:hypothetical protein